MLSRARAFTETESRLSSAPQDIYTRDHSCSSILNEVVKEGTHNGVSFSPSIPALPSPLPYSLHTSLPLMMESTPPVTKEKEDMSSSSCCHRPDRGTVSSLLNYSSHSSCSSSSSSSSHFSASSWRDVIHGFGTTGSGAVRNTISVQQEYWKLFSEALHNPQLVEEYLAGLENDMDENVQTVDANAEEKVGGEGKKGETEGEKWSCGKERKELSSYDSPHEVCTSSSSPPIGTIPTTTLARRVNRWNPYRCPPKSETLQEENRRSQLQEFHSWVPRCAIFVQGTSCLCHPPERRMGGVGERGIVGKEEEEGEGIEDMGKEAPRSSSPPSPKSILQSGCFSTPLPPHPLHSSSLLDPLSTVCCVPPPFVQQSLVISGHHIVPSRCESFLARSDICAKKNTSNHNNTPPHQHHYLHPNEEGWGMEGEHEEYFAFHGVVSHTLEMKCAVPTSRPYTGVKEAGGDGGGLSLAWSGPPLPPSSCSSCHLCYHEEKHHHHHHHRRGKMERNEEQDELEEKGGREAMEKGGTEGSRNEKKRTTPSVHDGKEMPQEGQHDGWSRLPVPSSSSLCTSCVAPSFMQDARPFPSFALGTNTVEGNSQEGKEITSPLQQEQREYHCKERKRRGRQRTTKMKEEKKDWLAALQREVEDVVFGDVWHDVILPFYDFSPPLPSPSSSSSRPCSVASTTCPKDMVLAASSAAAAASATSCSSSPSFPPSSAVLSSSSAAARAVQFSQECFHHKQHEDGSDRDKKEEENKKEKKEEEKLRSEAVREGKEEKGVGTERAQEDGRRVQQRSAEENDNVHKNIIPAPPVFSRSSSSSSSSSASKCVSLLPSKAHLPATIRRSLANVNPSSRSTSSSTNNNNNNNSRSSRHQGNSQALATSSCICTTRGTTTTTILIAPRTEGPSCQQTYRYRPAFSSSLGYPTSGPSGRGRIPPPSPLPASSSPSLLFPARSSSVPFPWRNGAFHQWKNGRNALLHFSYLLPKASYSSPPSSFSPTWGWGRGGRGLLQQQKDRAPIPSVAEPKKHLDDSPSVQHGVYALRENAGEGGGKAKDERKDAEGSAVVGVLTSEVEKDSDEGEGEGREGKKGRGREGRTEEERVELKGLAEEPRRGKCPPPPPPLLPSEGIRWRKEWEGPPILLPSSPSSNSRNGHYGDRGSGTRGASSSGRDGHSSASPFHWSGTLARWALAPFHIHTASSSSSSIPPAPVYPLSPFSSPLPPLPSLTGNAKEGEAVKSAVIKRPKQNKEGK